MISEDCDVDRLIGTIKELPYHEVLTFTIKEGYACDDLLVHCKKEGASEEDLERVREYRKAIQDFLFLLQMGQRPDYITRKNVENYNKFRVVAENLVKKGELLPAILNFFDR
ncbi:MAG: hypothetical protein GKC10_05965 [Methanosarcinales archaeon]|nr:hypothetical protein [Methanosarcinales archaeon]